ncbi:MAG: RecX family transcriptional regulator [Firmicutes bacterium]|nr:RecX family transcriptional regulator [Bacillota bacterium]
MCPYEEITIYYAEKQKGRMCSSGPVVSAALADMGAGGIVCGHLDSGAPVLTREDGSASGLFVSVSDTRRWILVCVAGCPVGIDAEEKGRTVKPSVVKALHPLEQRYLSVLEQGSSEWKREFLSIWTVKESYMKFCGRGLSMGLSGFSAVDGDLEPAQFVEKKGHPKARVIRCDEALGLVVSVCVDPESSSEGCVIRLKKASVEFPPLVSAVEKAATLLDGRAYSEKGLARKLREQGYSEEEAGAAGSRLAAMGYLDDEAFGERLAEKLYSEGKGRLLVVRTLKEKGVSAELAAELADRVSESFPSEGERALAAALKACGIREPGAAVDEKTAAKAARRLSSLGYESSVIWSVLEKLRRTE